MSAGEPIPLSILGRAAGKADTLHQRVTELYEAYRDGIYRFLVAQGLSPALAQEITQDVFLKLFVAMRNGVTIESEQGWLYSVAARSAVDYWRREGRPIWIGFDAGAAAGKEVPAQSMSPEALAMRAQQLRRVAAVILRLPKEQRLCLHLRSQGLRYREIAKVLGVGVSTAAEWVANAVKRVREDRT